MSDSILTNKIVEERIIYDTAYVEVVVEVEKEVEVEVPENYPLWSQTYIQPTTGNGVDILWVVDPSGSMNQNWPQVVLGVEQMMAALPMDINWRLEIITADEYRARLIQSFPILPGDSLQIAQNHLQNNVVGYSEEGLDAVKAYMMLNQDAQQWMRPDASLLVVFVSLFLAGLSIWITGQKLTFKTGRGDLVSKDLPYVKLYKEYRQHFKDLEGMIALNLIFNMWLMAIASWV